jgi:transposase-like protein
MTGNQPMKAVCPKCRNSMIYVTAIAHHAAPDMRRTTFICYTCNRTRSYMLSTAMAEGYAVAAARPEVAEAHTAH